VKTGLLVLVTVLLAVAGCGGDDAEPASATEPTASRAITVSSPAFAEGGTIPATYTCHGDGTSPPLEWSGVTDSIGSLALVVDDPDAPGGGYVHWVVLGLPAQTGGFDAGSLPDGATELDASGGPGWTPPCPPSGTHHYRFTVYAFASGPLFAWSNDTALDEVLGLIADNAIAWGRLTGTVTAK
jgi:Raf kinase inhibitor-like YbhB/YbcL family protein